MRFPFTFMGLMSLAVGVWIFLYLATHHAQGPVSAGVETAMGFVMVGFGSWVVWKRLIRREQL